MLTATSRRLMLVAVALAVCGAARQAQATTITFDNPITTPNAGQPNNLAGTFNQYQPPAPGGTAFNTQGYAFNGVTTGVTGGNTTPELNIVLDPSLCVANIGVACTSDGSQYLATNQPFGLFPRRRLAFRFSPSTRSKSSRPADALRATVGMGFRMRHPSKCSDFDRAPAWWRSRRSRCPRCFRRSF